MSIVPPRRVGAVLASGAVLGAALVGSSMASTGSHLAPRFTLPAQTVTAGLITRPPHTLAIGTVVKPRVLGERVFVNATHGFALAAGSNAQYPAATTDGGKTWRTDGPALHINAAQAPFSIVALGASSAKTVYAYGSGQVVDTTSDAGKHWYRSVFDGVVMAVVPGVSGHLVAFIDVSLNGTGTDNATYQYVSKNGGKTWHYTTTTGGG